MLAKAAKRHRKLKLEDYGSPTQVVNYVNGVQVNEYHSPPVPGKSPRLPAIRRSTMAETDKTKRDQRRQNG